MNDSGGSVESPAVDYSDYRDLREAAIAVLSSSLRESTNASTLDTLCVLERAVYGSLDRRERAMLHLVNAAQLILRLTGAAERAQRDWEQQPDPGALTYTDVIVRAVVTEMVRLNKTGKVGTHYLVDEYDLKALLSVAHSLPVPEWPVNFDLGVMRRIEQIVGHE
jgi:hypothetical protein